MASSRVFTSTRGQAIRLPKAVAFPEDVHQVDILKIGRSRIIVPQGKRWDDLKTGRVRVKISWPITNSRWPSRLAFMPGFPRIEQRYTDGLEVCNVAGDDGQAMNHRRRSDQGITFGAAIGNMKARATLRHSRIDSQDAAVEARQNLIVDPAAQNCALRGVLARYQEHAKLDFQNRDGREKKVSRWYRASPCDHVAIRLVRPSEFGDDIGVQQEHQPRSAGLNISSPTRGGSKSKSASPGWARASARLMLPPVRRR